MDDLKDDIKKKIENSFSHKKLFTRYMFSYRKIKILALKTMNILF